MLGEGVGYITKRARFGLVVGSRARLIMGKQPTADV